MTTREDIVWYIQLLGKIHMSMRGRFMELMWLDNGYVYWSWCDLTKVRKMPPDKKELNVLWPRILWKLSFSHQRTILILSFPPSLKHRNPPLDKKIKKLHSPVVKFIPIYFFTPSLVIVAYDPLNITIPWKKKILYTLARKPTNLNNKPLSYEESNQDDFQNFISKPATFLEDAFKKFEEVAPCNVVSHINEVLAKAINSQLQKEKEIASKVDGEIHLPSPPTTTQKILSERTRWRRRWRMMRKS